MIDALRWTQPLLALFGPLAVVLAAAMVRWRRRPELLPAPSVLGGPRRRSARQRTLFLLPTLRGVALLLLGIALAGPQRATPQTSAHPARDIVLCVDASSSMARFEPAFDGQRIAACKESLQAFVAAREGDRLSVLRFARSPSWACPPTLDHDAVAVLLDELEPTDVGDPEDRTGIGAALAMAARSLASSPLRSRVVVLVTDGENNVDEVPVAAAFEWCREEGVQVFALSVGSERAARTLDPWCRELGGRALAIRDRDALDRVLEQLDTRELSPLELPPGERREDLGGACLWIAALAWLLAFVLERWCWTRWA